MLKVSICGEIYLVIHLHYMSRVYPINMLLSPSREVQASETESPTSPIFLQILNNFLQVYTCDYLSGEIIVLDDNKNSNKCDSPQKKNTVVTKNSSEQKKKKKKEQST